MNTRAYHTFLRDLGMYLHLPAVLTVPTLVVIFHFEEWFALLPFGLMAAISLGLGQLLYHLFKKAEETGEPSTLVLVSFVWLVIAILGIIPFFGVAISIPEPSPATSVFADPLNAFFESMSGFTGTGLTMVEDPSQLPRVLQWWRSLTEWVGGVGVVVLGMVFLDLRQDNKMLYMAETRTWTIDDLGIKPTVFRMWGIFLVYTILAIGGFRLAGMPTWEAINHGMTGISTGGFAITSDSFIGYSPTIKTVGIVVMLAGAFSFKIHYLLVIRRNLSRAGRQTQLKYFIFLFVLAIGGVLWINPDAAIVDNFFQVASALGTCGFNSVPLENWMMPVLFLLTIAMLLGGNGSSTTGGIKTQRVAWLTKAIGWQLRRIWQNQKKDPDIYFNGKPVEQEEARKTISRAATILALWFIFLAAGTMSLTLMVGDQYELHQILFDAASALNNVGLSAGVNGADLPGEAKLVFICLMWMGRLEIFAVMVLITSPYWLFSRKLRNGGTGRE